MTKTDQLLRIMLKAGPTDATTLGAMLWKADERAGRIASTNGGGDYAAQMLLGRLRVLGLVRADHRREGSSHWVLTEAGRKRAQT